MKYTWLILSLLCLAAGEVRSQTLLYLTRPNWTDASITTFTNVEVGAVQEFEEAVPQQVRRGESSRRFRFQALGGRPPQPRRG